MRYTHGFKVLLTLSIFLSACQGAKPTYELKPNNNELSTEGNSGTPGNFDEASNLDPAIWPKQLLTSTRVVCELPRGPRQRATLLQWTTAAATETAGMRLALFKVGEADRALIPGDQRRPLFTSQNGPNSFDLVFEGQLPLGPAGGEVRSRTHVLLGSVAGKETEVAVWTVLPEIRLETQSRMNTLPAWMSLSHSLKVTETDFVLPAKSGAGFELFAKNSNDFGFENLKPLGLTLNDSFPVASFEDAVIFQRNTGSVWSLVVVENLRGTPERKSVASTARYLADIEKDSFWAWTQKTSKDWTLNRYSLRAGTYSAESSRSPVLTKPYLARRFEVTSKDAQGEVSKKVGFMIARDDLRKIQLLSENFELYLEIPYPEKAIGALNAKRVANSAVYLVEFGYGPGENKVSLVHVLLGQLKGPMTRNNCSNPNF